MKASLRRPAIVVAALVVALGVGGLLGWLYATPTGRDYRLSRMDRNGLTAYARSRPDDADAQRRLGDRLLLEGFPLEAARVYGEAGKTMPPNTASPVWFLTAQGRAYLQAGQLAKAGDALQEAVRRAPTDADANAALGEWEYIAGNQEQAEASFETARRNDSNNVAALTGLAAIYANKKNLADARDLAKRVAELAPDSGAAFRAQGYVEDQAGNAKAAVELLTRAAEKEPNRGQTWLMLSGAAVRAAQTPEEYEKARAALDKAETLLPGLAETAYNRGVLLARQNRHAEAIAEFQQTLERDPNSTRSLYQLATSLALAGKKDESAAVRARFEDARNYERESNQLRLRLARQPERTDLWQRLKELAQAHGDTTTAQTAEQHLRTGQ